MPVLDETKANEALRRVLDRCLDGVAALLEAARSLPAQLTDRRLATESAVILRLAQSLVKRLRRGDPLAERIVIPRLDFVCLAVAAAVGSLVRRGISPKARAMPNAGFSGSGDGSGT